MARDPAALEFRELESQYSQNPDSREVRDHWRAMWQATAPGGRLATADVYVIRDIHFLGWQMATRDGRFREASQLLASFFEHPEADQLDATWSIALRALVAQSLLRAEDEQEALIILRSLMENTQKGSARSALCHARKVLWEYCSHQSRADPGSESLTDLVREIDHRLRRRKLRRWRPEVITYGELCEILLSTFPPENQPSLRAKQEARARSREAGDQM